VARRAHRLQCFPEHAPRHDAIQFHQRIPQRPQRPQLALPGLLIETIPAGGRPCGKLRASHFTSTAAAWGGFANRSEHAKTAFPRWSTTACYGAGRSYPPTPGTAATRISSGGADDSD
jgi:hypothetical protein